MIVIYIAAFYNYLQPRQLRNFNFFDFHLSYFLFFLFFTILFPQLSTDNAIGNFQSNRFTQAEIELIQKSFLKRFGMKEVPKQEKPSLPIPKYIWDIYDQVKNENIEWVRHYYPQRIMESNEGLLYLRYNLSVSVQNLTDERIMHAYLKLKLNQGFTRRQVKVYEIDQRNTDVRRVINSKFIDANPKQNHQWVDLEVSAALVRKRPNKNMVEFAIELSDGKLSSTPSSSITSISAMPYSKTQAAALIVYVESKDAARKVRKKRRAGSKRRHQHRKHNHRLTGPEKNFCRRKELQVNFSELNWQDWILAPLSYSAYQCQGDCPIPLSNHFNATNHAIIQGLINSINPSLVPAPCCVPVEMQSLAILYVDVESKIVIKNYPDMEVMSCGCR